MGSIYPRGNKLWCRVKLNGTWISKPTGLSVGEEAAARKFVERLQARLDVAAEAGERGPLTFRRFIARWLRDRETAGHDWKQDRGRLEKHVLPVIGDIELAKVRTADVARLVRRMRFETKIAPRTVRNVYSVVAAAMRDAAVEGLIEATPCILTSAHLGEIVDKDPEWRPGAVFTREEAEQLISDTEIPLDRQLVYGFGLLAGLRPGEGAALRWRNYDARSLPLGRLTVATSYNTKRSILKGTKTETTRSVPVHPTLAAMLAEWRLSGWAAMIGRVPNDGDLIVPLPPTVKRTRRTGDPFRGYDYSSKRWREVDLPMLGWRERSLYDTKSTFITLAIDDGARPDIIRDRVTHTKRRRDAFDGYDRGEHWAETCREVAKLRIQRRATGLATVIELSSENTGSGGGFRTPEFATSCTRDVQVLDGEIDPRVCRTRQK